MSRDRKRKTWLTRHEQPNPELDLIGRRLMQEINLLKLEGALFCFDPREAKRRRGTLMLSDARKQPVTVEIHPNYGQPSVLAYKVRFRCVERRVVSG